MHILTALHLLTFAGDVVLEFDDLGLDFFSSAVAVGRGTYLAGPN
jgi:hypothetical protein